MSFSRCKSFYSAKVRQPEGGTVYGATGKHFALGQSENSCSNSQHEGPSGAEPPNSARCSLFCMKNGPKNFCFADACASGARLHRFAHRRHILWETTFFAVIGPQGTATVRIAFGSLVLPRFHGRNTNLACHAALTELVHF